AGSGLPAEPIRDALRRQYFVTRHDVGTVRGVRVHPFDLAVTDERIAFVVPEALEGFDLSGDGVADDSALVLFQPAHGALTPLTAAMTSDAANARLAMTATHLAFQTERTGSTGVTPVVGVRDLAQPLFPTFHCDDPSSGAAGILAPGGSEE